MLFKALIKEHGDLRCLQHVVTTISKNGKECALILRDKNISFVIREETKRCLPLIWAEMTKEAIFSQYVFRGCSPANNEIVLSLNPGFLARALGPVRAFETIKLKLNKIEGNSYLSVNILTISSVSSEKKNIEHNIPVKVVTPRKWELFCLPELPTFNGIVELPNVKHIVDKYKNLSPSLTIFADITEKRLHFTIETDMTTLISNFHNLHAEYYEDDDNPRATPPNREFSCQVDARSLSLFLSSMPNTVLQKSLLINETPCVKLRFVVKEDVVIFGIAAQISD